MSNIAIKEAIMMIGHADPDTKIKGWLVIGEVVTDARKRFGIGVGNRNNEAAAEYRSWLKKSGIQPAISDSSAARAGQLFEKRNKFLAFPWCHLDRYQRMEGQQPNLYLYQCINY